MSEVFTPEFVKLIAGLGTLIPVGLILNKVFKRR